MKDRAEISEDTQLSSRRRGTHGAVSELSGRCLCGAVRFAGGPAIEAGFCHCATCRRHSGAPVAAWVEVARADFEITAGEPARYASSERGRRAFCRDCGSVLWFEDDRAVSINAGALDDPAAIEPRVHIWVEKQLPWLELDDLLPKFVGGQRPPASERRLLRGPADPAVVRGAALELRPVDKDNLGEVLLLAVTGPQRRFVASNAESIAQGLLDGGAWIRAIYAVASTGAVAVGFAMAVVLDDDELGLPMAGGANLWRFMIDRRYQGLGFGSRALDMVIAELSGWPGVDAIWLGAVRGPGSPYDFYIARGFEDTGVGDADGERILKLAV